MIMVFIKILSLVVYLVFLFTTAFVEKDHVIRKTFFIPALILSVALAIQLEVSVSERIVAMARSFTLFFGFPFIGLSLYDTKASVRKKMKEDYKNIIEARKEQSSTKDKNQR